MRTAVRSRVESKVLCASRLESMVLIDGCLRQTTTFGGYRMVWLHC